jgi:glycosyltransferase involved in cell wall biosynthesis
MNIIILEPYLTGSHAAWAEEYARYSRHEIKVLGLPGRHWKWRMHGGAVTLAKIFNDADYRPDLVLAGDMLDLTTFLALTRKTTARVRTAVYFHENQLSYPWSKQDPDPHDRRDVHYGFINFTSALAADSVIFNSAYHQRSFLEALGPFLNAFPDHNEEDAVRRIEAKSHVLHLGMDLRRLDRYRTVPDPAGLPLILWNHRWEYDKRPDDFFRALFQLSAEGVGFQVAVLGEAFRERPPVFKEASSRLGGRIVRMGYVEDFASYATWLWKADIVPVTSIQDFFGASVVSAVYCNCYPLLPDRLAYPEHIPSEKGRDHLYRDFADLVDRLRYRLANITETRQTNTQHFVRHYDWESMGPVYDDFFESART